MTHFFRSVGTKLSAEKNEKKLAARCRAPILGDVMNNTNTNTLAKVKTGHLYFHHALGRVERIVGVSESGDVLHRHHAESNVSRAEAFRIATRDEVKAYLGK